VNPTRHFHFPVADVIVSYRRADMPPVQCGMSSLSSAREVLSNRQFALLWSGQTMSQLGDGVLSVALPLLVLAITRNATDLGLVIAARLVPTVAFLLLGGVVSDRVSRRLAMLTSDASRALITLSMGVLALSGSLNFSELLVGSILFGVFDALFYPASTALLPELVMAEQLTSSNSLSRFSGALAGGLIGPIVGGVIASTIGTSWSLVIDAGTFLVSAGSLLAMRSTPRPESSDQRGSVVLSKDALDILDHRGRRLGECAGFLTIGNIAATALQARSARPQLDGGRRLRGSRFGWPRRRRCHDHCSPTESPRANNVAGLGRRTDPRGTFRPRTIRVAGVTHRLRSGSVVDGWQYPLGVAHAVRSSEGDPGARLVS